MMIKYRVHEVAKDFDMPNNKEIISLLEKYTGETKKHMTALEENELDIIFDYMTQNNQVENFERYFSMGAESKKKREEAAAADKAALMAQQQAIAEQLLAAKAAAEGKPAPKKADEKTAGKSSADDKTKANQDRTKADQAKPAKPHGVSDMQPFKKKEKKEQDPALVPKRGPAQTVHVDTRGSQVELDKYNEKYTRLASGHNMKDNVGYKQKIKQKSIDHRRPQGAKRETEADKLRRIQLERIKKTPIKVTIGDEITVAELASRMKKTAADVVKQLMKLGVMAAVNEVIDFDTASIVATEMGAVVEREVVVTIEDRIMDDTVDTEENLKPRNPVVVVMGHVDHGKTSILDAIRNTSVTSTEAGGITQHIGAYRVHAADKDITFLDTPGHAAFTSMRARGAQITDIAVLVVAADDGIMPQTIEAINHAKAAGVQIIVAINKMDKEGANPDRVMQQLTEYELVPEAWGGDVICVPVSAHTGQGIKELLESIALVADMLELKANPDRAAKGAVIEARLDKRRRRVATLLVQNGTLHSGDIIVAGSAVGRVRVMTDDRGEKVDSAGLSMPVEITGMDECPSAGDSFDAVSNERLARELVEQRKQKAKNDIWDARSKVTLDNLFDQMQLGEMKELNIIVKADVQGSVEAVSQSLIKLSNDEVKVNIIHGGVGAISESDVMLANASNAIIVGFNVRPEVSAQQNAERDGVDMRMYRIIYDCIDEIGAALKGMLAPKYREVNLGRIEVRQVYKISSAGTIAGCYVTDGKVTRTADIRVVRDGIVITEDKISSLRRFKDDVKEVAEGYECGIGLEKFNDIKEGDIYEAFTTEEYRD